VISAGEGHFTRSARVVLDKVAPEQAVDEMIDRIKKIVSD